MGEKRDKQAEVESFGILVKEHQAAVRAFVVSRIDDPIEAQDIAQKVFLIAFRKLGEWDETRPVRPWLMGIALNEVRNHRRKFRPIVMGSSHEILNLLESKLDTSESCWKEGPVFEALEFCMAKLEEKGRDLLRLRYEEGLEIAEIRTFVGGKHSTITMKLHRLRESLRDCIETRMGKAATHG